MCLWSYESVKDHDVFDGVEFRVLLQEKRGFPMIDVTESSIIEISENLLIDATAYGRKAFLI